MLQGLLSALGLPLLLFTVASCQRLVPITAGSSSQGQYNSPCLASSQCRQDQGLYCVPNINDGNGNQPRCRCPTNTTIYDEVRHRCVGRINENCVYQGNSSYCPQNSHCSHQDPRNPSLYFYNSQCFCDPNYIPNEKGTCTPAARYNEFCNHSDKKCDVLAGLKCDPETSTCICEFDTDQYYEKEKGKCLSFIGKRCTTYYGCVENARCDGLVPLRSRTVVSATDSRKPAGSDSAVLKQKAKQYSASGRLLGKCVCEYGFSPANNGRCMASFRSPCDVTNQCNPFDNLECFDGNCNCKSPLHQFYDYTRKKCMGLVGAKCTGKPPGNNEECVDNADCVNGRCTCKHSYSHTPHRKCLLDYQEACEFNSSKVCNYYNGIVCKSQQCVCMDESLVYNKKLAKCVSQVSQPCGKIGQAGDYGKEPYHVGCEPPAVCKQEVDGDLTTSFCRV